MSNKVNPEYQKMIEQIKIDSNKYADEQMKDVYKDQNNNLDEIHKMIGLIFIKYATGGLLKLTSSQKASITNEVNIKLKAMIKPMVTTETKKVTSILSRNYQDTYNKSAYVMNLGIKTNLNFDLVTKEQVNAAVNTKMQDKMYSDRIWEAKSEMIGKVSNGLVDAMKGDTTIDEIGKTIQSIFNVGAYVAQRLVNTENTRIQTQATDDIGNNTGITKQLYTATLEGNTCSDCAALDGNIYDIDDPDKPQIPEDTHPNCRCCYINIPNDDWQPTQRKDNETKDIIDYKDYDQWADHKGIDEE